MKLKLVRCIFAASPKEHDRIAVDYFIDAISDPDLKRHLMQNEPHDIRAAVVLVKKDPHPNAQRGHGYYNKGKSYNPNNQGHHANNQGYNPNNQGGACSSTIRIGEDKMVKPDNHREKEKSLNKLHLNLIKSKKM